ncbi:hypothetical protein HGRIS_005635 [Hohenbuehelia grisea]|uniref:Uncharacterized protein n=1 Tax=Hohenbuehelia grisea TaxID=104357 RepID=A0ABR3JXF7_9AGAR
MKLSVSFAAILLGITQLSLAAPAEQGAAVEQAEEASEAPAAATGRFCFYGDLVDMPVVGPDVVRIEPQTVWGPKWGIMDLKRFMRPLIATVASGAHTAATRNQQNIWWQSMYDAGICAMQERLKAENDWLYKMVPKQQTTSEPIYYKVPPIFPPLPTPADQKRFCDEITANNNKIAQARRNAGGLYQWMIPGFQKRNQQLAARAGKNCKAAR